MHEMFDEKKTGVVQATLVKTQKKKTIHKDTTESLLTPHPDLRLVLLHCT